MLLKTILSESTLKAKEKTQIIARHLVNDSFDVATVIDVATNQKDAMKAICLEACEYAVRMRPDCSTPELVDFAIPCLREKAPRVKWEAAKVIGNCIARYSDRIEEAIPPLLENTEHSGTVVRWTAAYALSEILMLRTPLNHELIPVVEAIIKREEKNSIRKMYTAALKKATHV